jgi:hypothetical protein
MSDHDENYEYALNGADSIHNEGFWTAVSQADETELEKWVVAFRAVGLDHDADLLQTYLNTDAKVLEEWKSAPVGNSEFKPSRDWDAEFAKTPFDSIEEKLEEFRVQHGLSEL